MKLNICKYCGDHRKNSNSLRSHERLCKHNPLRCTTFNKTGKQAWNKGLKKEDNASLRSASDKVKQNWKDGLVNTDYLNDPLYRKKLSESAKLKCFGGYRENSGRSKKYNYIDSYGKTVCLQSSYELECAKILDELKIKWIRPRFLIYNGGKKYFPDFYLTECDIYLDPKNDYLAKADANKISNVCEQNNVNVLIITKENLNIDFISKISTSAQNGNGLA